MDDNLLDVIFAGKPRLGPSTAIPALNITRGADLITNANLLN